MVSILLDYQLDFKLGLDAVLAHEFAHNIQYRKGLQSSHPLPMVASKFMELQADCIAGLILETHHDLTVDDILEASRLMTIIADSGFVGDHGTAVNRITAFNMGVESALTSPLGARQNVDDLVRACSFDKVEKIIFPNQQ